MSRDSLDNSSVNNSEAWWITGQGKGDILAAPVDACPPGFDGDAVTVETLFSGVSRGTESLVFQGQVPESEYGRMRAPFQQGSFPFPVKYGYANVGRVVAGPAHFQGNAVFCLFPHQARYRVPAEAVACLPEGLPPARAVLAANMETAINGLWDGGPGIGDRIAVVGLGVVGLLVAWLANRIPGTRVTAVDINPDRRAVAERLGLTFASTVEQDDHDLVFHASGHASGLNTALELAGPESVIVEMSWYGEAVVEVPLGKAFHSRRLTIRSSQVGQISPLRQPRWNYQKRMELALDLLRDDTLDALISGKTRFGEMPETMSKILTDGSHTLCHRIVY
ncbi:dehydrogenase [Marinobacter salinus]|uniref:Dehydrogenase n=1 Tax=Marinobacter salinus TaxID=1874317 RepID=A0A1D9GIM3_9GAMM|nr:zinc-binding alcohol dehydrogenase [Marinobacter salinus]AOY87488.1 dehydrogenase [Marinobacter salinus]